MLHPLRVVGAIGSITRLFSMSFAIPILGALAYDPFDTAYGGISIPRNVLVFVFCGALTYLSGAAMTRIAGQAAQQDLADREAYLTVGLGWLALCVFSMIPFMMTGTLLQPVDAFFEAMSGLTTTGSTVIAGELEAVSHSVMLWRATLQYIGGMGIIVLSVAILSRLTQGGQQMLQAEVPGPSFSRVAPRLAETARMMWGVYLGLSAALFVALFLRINLHHGFTLKETFYEALIHTFTSMSTGGFSNHTASIAFFDDAVIEMIIIAFILLAGTNFTLILLARRGNWTILRDGEWRLYIGNFVIISSIIALVLWQSGYGMTQSLRDSAFVVATMMTSTGFGTADYATWPNIARMLIVFVMVAGGSAGSTAGGLKMVRVLLLWKLVRRELTRIAHPNTTQTIRIAGQVVKPRTVMATVGFFFAFILIWVAGTVALEVFDPAFTDSADAASASLSALSNIGPGLGVVGPTQNFAGLTTASKVILSMEMWFGRLEIFTALLVFLPQTWRH